MQLRRTNPLFNISRIAVISLLAIAVVGGGYWWVVANNSNPIPADIRKGLAFSPLVIPNGTNGYSTGDYKYTKAENDVYILSYSVDIADGNKVVITEYPQPQEFTEVAEYKERFLTNIANQYETVQSASGTIYLGRMAKQDGKQLAVMLEKGLLIFLTPSQEMDSSKWRSLAEKLEIKKSGD